MKPILSAAAAILISAAGARAAPLVLTFAASAYSSPDGAALKAPEGLACTSDGKVVVADSGNRRLLVFAWKGGTFDGGTPIKFDELGFPTRVQIDAAGNVLALDQQGRRIVRVGVEGKFDGFVSMRGVPVEAGYAPVAFKLDRAGAIYVLDVTSARVVVLDRAGAFVRQVRLPERRIISDIGIDAAGTLYAVDAIGGTVYKAAAGSGAFAVFAKGLKEYLNYPVYIDFNDRGQILLVDQNGNGIVVLGPDGSFQGRQLSIGWSDGLVYYPAQICSASRGVVFVADRNNNRVQAFSTAQ
ncbi:MAG TPA: NHL repeat-containing protein [Myxococcales bacterium]|nr:NHL repeat-containing protein [Myxococcales bacterium]